MHDLVEESSAIRIISVWLAVNKTISWCKHTNHWMPQHAMLDLKWNLTDMDALHSWIHTNCCYQEQQWCHGSPMVQGPLGSDWPRQKRSLWGRRDAMLGPKVLLTRLWHHAQSEATPRLLSQAERCYNQQFWSSYYAGLWNTSIILKQKKEKKRGHDGCL